MKLRITFTPDAWDDYQHFVTHDRKIVRRINQLITDIARNGDTGEGIGKPERLRGDLTGLSSRRVTGEHRLVYEIDGPNQQLIIISCRYHYG